MSEYKLKKKSFSLFLFVLLLFFSFIAGIGGAFTYQYFLQEDTKIVQANVNVAPEKFVEQKVYIEESQTIDAIKKVSPAVFSIVATKDLKVFYNDPFSLFFGDPFFENFQDNSFRRENAQPNREPEVKKQQIGGGSGFLIAADGLAITNGHVVLDKTADYTAVFKDGKEYAVEVVDMDSDFDLAVIQLFEKVEKDKKPSVKPKDLPFVIFGSSQSLEVGQKVLAIGNALAEYENTVTSGIISAVGREIVAGGYGFSEQLSGLIQTDAGINPGNSGGPLINLAGEVVGINVAMDRKAANIGFAIPVDDIKSSIASIKENGKIVKPMLGVRYLILNENKAKELKLGISKGALLVGDELKGEFAVIPGSSADKAGLKIRDVILDVDGKSIDQNYSLRQAIRGKKVGDKLKLKIWRSNETFEKELVLEEFKNNQ